MRYHEHSHPTRMFTLCSFAFATSILLSMAIVLNAPETTFAQSATCSAPTFYSLSVPPAYLNAPWSMPLLSTLEGQFTPTVTAKNLPPGIELQDQKTTLTAGGSVLHNWLLSGAPSQMGTYSITVVAQNSCGGASTVITLPVNNATTALGQVCPAGTQGVYPNCTALPKTTTTTASTSVATSAPTFISTPIPAAAPVAPKAPTPAQTPAPSALSNTNACAVISSTIRQGSRGSDVAALQGFLIQKGFLPAGSATGFFGAQTRSALQQFQIQQGIVSSGSEDTTGFGMVGARTRAALSAACGGTAVSPTTVVPLTSLPICPKVPVPPCPGGSVVSVGTDANHCAIGYACKPANAACPTVAYPSCTGGKITSMGSDPVTGCSLGYMCTPVSCPSIPVLTSCPAGQKLVSGTDQYGCPNVSYCSGGTSSTSGSPGSSIQGPISGITCPVGSHADTASSSCVPDTSSPQSIFSNFFNNLGSFGSSFGSYFDSYFGGNTSPGQYTIQPAVPVSQPPGSGSLTDANASFNTFYTQYGNATLTKCTKSDGSTIYVAKGFNSDNSKFATRVFPDGAAIVGTCELIGALGPQSQSSAGAVPGTTFDGVTTGLGGL